MGLQQCEKGFGRYFRRSFRNSHGGLRGFLRGILEGTQTVLCGVFEGLNNVTRFWEVLVGF